MIFAIPLLFVPGKFMSLFGWSPVDPIMSRLVGAALLGIGVESFLGRNANRNVYKAMLNLKIIWSSGVVVGSVLGIATGGPDIAWAFLAIFAVFLSIWSYYRFVLR
jgi:hypothetical protein